MNFKELEIKQELKKAVAEMGFEQATPIQKEAIPQILQGNDFIGIAATGTGKTGAFGLPILEKVDTSVNEIQTVILCPTRELVIQICEELKNMGKYLDVKILPIYGGQAMDRQISGLKNKPHIVVGTPGRVMDHLRRRSLRIADISTLVLDEADEMLNMGFREDLDIILKTVNKQRQTLLFSATMSKDIMTITKQYQKENVVKSVMEHKEMSCPQIKQYVVRLQEAKKMDALTRILDSEDYKLSVIFCNTKRKVDELEEKLTLKGYFIKALHGDMEQRKRDNVMARFRSGKINVLVATDVAARGIDVENVEAVFNYDIPYDEEYYVHRIGRTGRAGKKGVSISFVTPREMSKMKDIQKYTKTEMQDYEFLEDGTLKEKKYSKLFSTLDKILVGENLEEEIKVVEKYLENSQNNSIEILAALVKNSIADSVDSKDILLKEEKGRSHSVEAGKVRLFLTVGKLDELTKNTLRDYIVENAGVDRSTIHGAEVLDKFSFLTVSEQSAKEIMKKLNNTKYGKRKLMIEESKK